MQDTVSYTVHSFLLTWRGEQEYSGKYFMLQNTSQKEKKPQKATKIEFKIYKFHAIEYMEVLHEYIWNSKKLIWLWNYIKFLKLMDL